MRQHTASSSSAAARVRLLRQWFAAALVAALALFVGAAEPVAAATADFTATTVELDTDQPPLSVAMGDLDEDGHDDLVTAHGTGGARVLWGDDAGVSTATDLPGANVALSVVVDDVDGDGNLDVVNTARNWVAVFWGDGARGFVESSWNTSGTTGGPAAVGDLNDDGHPDLAVAAIDAIDAGGFSEDLDAVLVLLSDGAHGFTETQVAIGLDEFGGDAGPVVMGDFSGDGHLDLATANRHSNPGWDKVWVLWNDGAGNFTAGTHGAGEYPVSLAVGDLDGDGHLELATGNLHSNNVSVLSGDGAGGFTATTHELGAAGPPASLAVGDLNGDSNLDLATANESIDNVSVLSGDGAGGFTTTTHEIGGGERPVSVAIGDLNGDSHLDLATANEASGNVSILLNTGPPNQPPVIGTITAPTDPVAVNTTVDVTAPFTDPDAEDTHSCTIDWGDDDTAETISPATSPCAGNHSYTAAGVHPVTVTVSDGDGGTDTQTFEYVVVYDPAGGFVTGGGWIDSPAGAYAPDLDLAGKATFGFVSKYKKGATAPDGSTQFRFSAGDLDFRSTLYEWLVIAGPKAQYKGSGTINGAGDYGFLLTANDSQQDGGGGVDRFRIKIWDKASGEPVYDNQTGDSDGDGATDAVEGGSIVIHTAKK